MRTGHSEGPFRTWATRHPSLRYRGSPCLDSDSGGGVGTCSRRVDPWGSYPERIDEDTPCPQNMTRRSPSFPVLLLDSDVHPFRPCRLVFGPDFFGDRRVVPWVRVYPGLFDGRRAAPGTL